MDWIGSSMGFEVFFFFFSHGPTSPFQVSQGPIEIIYLPIRNLQVCLDCLPRHRI